MFNYLVVNYVFNVIECFLSIFTLINECLGEGSIYCSSIMMSQLAIVYKIYILSYFGEAMKTCSVITMFLFSLERFKITANLSKIWILNKLSKMKMSRIIIFTLLISFLTCVNKMFEYDDDYYFSSIEIPDSAVKEILMDAKKKHWFFVIYLIHYILNDFLVLLSNFVVDLLLVKQIRKDLSIKRDNMLKLTNKGSSNSNNNNNNTANLSDQKKLKDLIKIEQNTNKMIIYSAIVYVICRFPLHSSTLIISI